MVSEDLSDTVPSLSLELCINISANAIVLGVSFTDLNRSVLPVFAYKVWFVPVVPANASVGLLSSD